MNKLLSIATFVCLGIAVCTEIRGEDKFTKSNVATAIMDIKKMRSDENLNSSERIEIREKSIAIIEHELEILFSLIKSSSDVKLLDVIVTDNDLFPFCIDFIITKQDKLDDDISNTISDYIVNNNKNNSTTAEYINKVILMDWKLNRYPEGMQNFIVKNTKENGIKFYAYFVLSDNMKSRLQNYYKAQSNKLLIGERTRTTHSIPLYATLLLASDGDSQAIDKLSKLIDEIDVNNNFDLFYIVVGSAITKQQKLLDKLSVIMKKDSREKFFGYDCVPQKISLKNEAAASLSILDENFPSTSFWEDTSGEHINKCIQWLEENKLNLNMDNQALIKKIQKTRLNDL